MMMIRNLGVLLNLRHTFRQQVYLSDPLKHVRVSYRLWKVFNVVGQVQQRKTAEHAAGCIFSKMCCILVKIHFFGEQMVFQHGTICSFGDGKVLWFFLLFWWAFLF